MTKKTKKDDDKKYIPDDRICIFYVADRIYDFENIKDHKKLQKEITEFKEELLQNIGIDVMIKREAKYHK
jgi:predicted secreted acid phosphatase